MRKQREGTITLRMRRSLKERVMRNGSNERLKKQ